MPDPKDTLTEPSNAMHRHECSDANVTGVFWSACGLTVMIVAGFAIALGFFDILTETSGGTSARESQESRSHWPPEPRLEGLETMRDAAAARETMHAPDYGWVDQGAGIARIPPQAVLQILADKLPARADTDHPKRSFSNGDDLPSPANSGRGARRSEP